MKLRLPISRGVLSGLLLLVCFSQSGFGVTDKAEKYDGESVFRGVLFGVGPVAKLFPEYYPAESEGAKADAQKTGERAARPEQHIIDAFRTEDAKFFDKFGAEMQSGDPVRISQAIEGAYQQLRSLNAKNNSNSNGHGSGGWYVHDPHRGGAPQSVPILAKWSHMSNIEKDTLVAQISKRLGRASPSKS